MSYIFLKRKNILILFINFFQEWVISFLVFPSEQSFYDCSFFFYSDSSATRSRRVTIAWFAGTSEIKWKENRRAVSFAVAVSRNILCGRDGTDKDIWIWRAQRLRIVGPGNSAGTGISRPFYSPRPQNPALTLEGPRGAGTVASATSQLKKKNISFTPLRGVAEPDKIAACLYTRRDVKANLHGLVLMIHPSWRLSTKGFLFQAGISIIHGKKSRESDWNFPIVVIWNYKNIPWIQTGGRYAD